MTRNVVFLALCAFMALAGAIRADDEIIVAEGDKLPKVKVGQVVRITASGIAGTEIKAAVTGDGKLQATRTVTVSKNGQTLIGNTTKEFEIKAEKKGKAKITVTTKAPNQDKAETKEYELEITD